MNKKLRSMRQAYIARIQCGKFKGRKILMATEILVTCCLNTLKLLSRLGEMLNKLIMSIKETNKKLEGAKH